MQRLQPIDSVQLFAEKRSSEDGSRLGKDARFTAPSTLLHGKLALIALQAAVATGKEG